MGSTKIVTLTLTMTLSSQVSTADEAMSPAVGKALADALTTCGFSFPVNEHQSQHWTITKAELLRACHA